MTQEQVSRPTHDEPGPPPGVTAQADGSRVNDPSQGSLRRSLIRHPAFQQSWTAIAFVVLFVGMTAWLGSSFGNSQARILDIHQSSAIIILALAAVTTLVAGHFDLSITGVATLSTYMVVGLTVKNGLSFWVALAVALGVGLIAGLINGILVEKFSIHAFIATLATGSVFTGIAAVYSNGQPISPGQNTDRLPEWFSGPGSFGAFSEKVPSAAVYLILALAALWFVAQLGRIKPNGLSPAAWRGTSIAAVVAVLALLFVLGLNDWVGQISYTIFFALLVTAMLWIVTRYTSFGRHLKAVGANPVAARLAGVSTARVGVTAYALSGFLSAVAGALMAANLGSASVEGAASYLLPAFSAAFLSTVLFSTGQFTIWGAATSVVLVVWLTQALSIGGVIFTWAAVINGIVLLIAVAVSSITRRER